jgi:multidrug transporter EmrE-like cation transporter
MFLVSLASLFSAIAFMICTFTALYFAIADNIGSSIGFALLAGIWFVLMVIFGYVYTSRR